MEEPKQIIYMSKHQRWGSYINFVDHRQMQVKGQLRRMPETNDILIAEKDGKKASFRFITVTRIKPESTEFTATVRFNNFI